METPDWNKSHLIRAGAGAGKTTTIVQWIEDFVEHTWSQESRFPQMVVTTFTRKATQELRERLMHKALTKLKTFNDSKLFDCVASNQNILICTIHGLLNHFLVRHGHSLGLDSQIILISDWKERKLELTALKDLLVNQPKFEQLLESQSISRLIAMLHETSKWLQVDPRVRGFSVFELKEIWQRRWDQLRQSANDVFGRILRETGQEDWKRFAQSHLDSCVFSRSEFLNPAELIELTDGLLKLRKPAFSEKTKLPAELNQRVVQIREDLTELVSDTKLDFEKHAQGTEQVLELSRNFVRVMTEKKRQLGVMTMSDLELLTLNLLRQHPDKAKVFGSDFDFWLIDEYQDTSPVQEKILKLLRGPSPGVVVGDPQQSIYLFRGSRAEVFERHQRNLEVNQGQISFLKSNYRSRSELVNFFNYFFCRMDSGFSPMVPTVTSPSVLPAVTFLAANDQTKEYEVIEKWLLTLLSQGVAADQICVLARTNSELKDLAKSVDSKIPCLVHASGGFGRGIEIQDALILLKFLVNPEDDTNALALLRSPYFYVEDHLLAEWRRQGGTLWTQANDHSVPVLRGLIEASQTKGITQVFTEALVRFGYFKYAMQSDSTGVAESNLFKLLSLLRTAQRESGFNYQDFINEIRQATDSPEDTEAVPAIEPARVNLMTIHRSKGLQFRHVVVLGFERAQRTSLSSTGNVYFDEDIARVVFGFPNDEGGLEKLFPAREIQFRLAERSNEESKRLLYVAFTRAAETLFVTSVTPKLGDGIKSGNKTIKGSWLEASPIEFHFGMNNVDQCEYRVIEDLPKPALVKALFDEAKFVPPLNLQGERDGRVSVTDLLKESQVGVTTIRAKFEPNFGMVERVHWGVSVHRALEDLAIRFRKGSDISDLLEHPQFGRVMKYVLNQSTVPIQRLFKEGSAEESFLFKQDQIIEGQIDLWGVVDDDLWVVDYKTSGKEDPSHREQLTIYAQALLVRLKRSKAILAIMYLESQNTVIHRIGH